MTDETKKKVEAAIAHCADKAAKEDKAEMAMKFTQAALNGSQALRLWHDQQPPDGKSP